MKVKQSIQMVTPAMANKWLEKNTRNRPIDKARVRNYVADMLRGAWTMSTDAIGFCEDGVLINGQHRLSAVCISGCAVPMLVVTGLDRGSQATMDIGQPRKVDQQIKLLFDIKNSRVAASVTRALVEWDFSRWALTIYRHSQTILGEQAVKMDAVIQPRIHDWHFKALSAQIHSPSTLTAWGIITDHGEPERAAEFMRGVVEGAGPGDARTVLRERLIGVRGQGRDLTLQCRHLIIHAWNAWVRGQKRVTLKTVSGYTPKALLVDDVHFGLVPRRSESVSDKEPSA
jgi:hypothetical protein